MNLGKYSKLIASVVGLLTLLLGPDFLGLTDNTAKIAELVIALLTAFGVYQVPNAE